MDEIEIISLDKKCNKKTKKASQPKKELSKSDEPKKVSGLIDDPGEEEQKPKKASRSSDGKKTTAKVVKKVKKTPQPKKAPKSPQFITDSNEEEEEGLPKDDKGKKIPPLLGVKEEGQSFFDLQKDSKNLTIEKKVEKVVFMAGSYEG